MTHPTVLLNADQSFKVSSDMFHELAEIGKQIIHPKSSDGNQMS
jgi:hypothetical protein